MTHETAIHALCGLVFILSIAAFGFFAVHAIVSEIRDAMAFRRSTRK